MKNLIIALIQSMVVMTTFASWDGTDYWALIRDQPTGTEEVDGVSWTYFLYKDLDFVSVWPTGSLPSNVVIPSRIAGYPVGEFYGVNGTDGWSVSIPGTVRRIERANFNGGLSSLTNLIVREDTSIRTVVEEEAFQECSQLKSVVLGEGVTEVRRWSFRFCSNLEKVVLPHSLQTIGAAAFADTFDYYGSPELMTFLETDGNSNYYIGDWLITGSDSSMIRAGTRGIADDAMNCGCVPDLPEGIEYIGERACGSILPWSIPASVKFIGSYAFGEPYVWYSFWSDGPMPYQDENGLCYYDGWCFGPVDWDGWFYDEMENFRREEELYKDEEWYQQQIQEEWWQQMKKDAEERQRNKQIIRIADGTIGIVSSAFNASGRGGNQVMTGIVFPDSLRYIGNYAFEYSPQLREINALTNLETVGKMAFSQCSALQDVNLGKKIETLPYGVFYECHGLTNLYCGAVNYDTLCLYSLSDYETVNLHLYRPIKYIGDSAFGSVNLIFEEGMTEIEKILGGEAQGEIVIPSSVTNIADNAFESCYALSNVIIKIVNSADVKFTGKVFSDKYQIKVVALPYNAKGYDDLIAQLGADKVKFTVGTESGFGQWVLVNGLAGQGSAADFDGKSGGNKYENGFLYIFGNEIENESVALIQLDKTKDGQIAFRIPETEHEDKVRVVGTANLNDWSNAIELKKEGDVWVMPDGTKPPDSFFCRVIISE